MSQRNVVLIAAGGTGGHIYPALAIASALRRQNPELKIEFVGNPMGMEGQIVPREGFVLHPVRIGRLNSNVSWRERIWTILTLPLAVLTAVFLVIRLRPRFVLGVGGAVTGPVLLGAALVRCPSYLWEPNAFPGLANRWLAPFVTEALVVFSATAERLKAKRFFTTGMPVRRNIEALEFQESPKGSTKQALRVLVFGGSQGARTLNTVVSELLAKKDPEISEIEFIHQTGANDFVRISEFYASRHLLSGKLICTAYIHDMDQKYRWADLVISRSGMSTVSELSALGKAAILVPLPTASDDHQTQNAKILAEKSAAILVPQSDFTVERLKTLLQHFLSHREEIDQMGRRIREFHRPQADMQIAEHLLEATSP